MHNQKVDYYILPNNNPYLLHDPNFNYLFQLTGFEGSGGVAIFGPDPEHYAFFVDGRYTKQAKRELKGAHEVIEIKGEADIWNWIKINIRSSRVVYYDPKLFSVDGVNKLEKAHNNISILSIESAFNLPPISLPPQSYCLHEIRYTGSSSVEKCKILVDSLGENEVLLISNPASICWLLNIRNHSRPHIPLVWGFALVFKDQRIEFFVNSESEVIVASNVNTHPLEEMEDFLRQLNQQIIFDPRYTNYATSLLFVNKHNRPDPCIGLKAIKNATEIHGAVNAHRKDAVALISFFHWLNNKNEANEEVTELSAEEHLFSLRSSQDSFRQNSFHPISAVGENAAIVHYHSSDKTNKVISGMYLLDSGGQYNDGTTDVTRTIYIGDDFTQEHKKFYTLVLKSHIHLAQAVFPADTRGEQLDTLARYFLWQNKIDYKHGSGHGVGSYLEIHEDGQSISTYSKDIIKPNMIVSNEPGCYFPGHFGIRLENLMLVKTSGEENERSFLYFEPLTKVPFCCKLIDFTLLDKSEQEWLQKYHNSIIEEIGPYLNYDTQEWLMRETAQNLEPTELLEQEADSSAINDKTNDGND